MGVDSFLILDDEESTDDTERVAYEEFAKYGIPGRVFTHHWGPGPHYLSDKRNALLAMPETREGLAPSDFLFTTPSDEHPVGTLDRSHLTEPLGLVTIQDMTSDPDPTHVAVPVEWAMPLFIRADVKCHWSGKVHELLEFDGNYTAASLSSPLIRRYGSHATLEQRAEQAQILEDELAREDAPRTAFYYAQTLQNLGRNEDAIAAYLHRATMTNGFDQEQFCALYRVGQLLEQSDPFKASRAFMDSWSMRPHRHEPLFHLAHIANKMGDHNMALMFCNQALMLQPTTDTMFVERWIEQWGIRYQWSVAAWWCRIPECTAVMDELLGRDDLPPTFRENIAANRLLPPLDEVEKQSGVKFGKPIGPQLDRPAEGSTSGDSSEPDRIQLVLKPARPLPRGRRGRGRSKQRTG